MSLLVRCRLFTGEGATYKLCEEADALVGVCSFCNYLVKDLHKGDMWMHISVGWQQAREGLWAMALVSR